MDTKLYEVYLEIAKEGIYSQDGQYISFLIVHVEDIIEDGKDEEAISKAIAFATKVLGIESSKVKYYSVDQLR